MQEDYLADEAPQQDVSDAEKLSFKSSDMSNERLVIWLNFWKFAVGTVAVGVITSVINWQIQIYQLQLDRQKREQDYVAQFLEQAMDENLEKRLRFAHYFSRLTLSRDTNILWTRYHQDLQSQALDAQAKIRDLRYQREALQSKSNLSDEEERQITLLEAQIETLEKDFPGNTPLLGDVFTWSPDLVNQPIAENVDFTWAEATHGGVRVPQTTEHARNIIALAIELQKVKDQLGRTIRVTSWYRPEPWNSRAGGKQDSNHLLGNAVDITVEGLMGKEVAAQLDWWPGGLQVYPGNREHIIHLDLGPRERRGLENNSGTNPQD